MIHQTACLQKQAVYFFYMLATKLNMIFGAITLAVILPLLFGVKWPVGFDLAILLITLALTGIPHGAIDHVVYESNLPQKLLPRQLFFRFFIPYLVVLGLTFLLWLLVPALMFWIFLLISAYHFGQSQLYHISLPEAHPLKWILYVAWGSIVLMLLWLCNWDAQLPMIQSMFRTWDLSKTGLVYGVCRWILITCSATTFVLLCYCGLKKLVKLNVLLQELGVLILLFFLIRFSSMYLSFAIYFGLWHSLRVIITEYKYLEKTSKAPITIASFSKAFLPFSLISFVGIGLLLLASNLMSSYVSPFMLFLVFISALTMPHAYVMKQMYGVLSRKPAEA